MAYMVGIYSFSKKGKDLAEKICKINCDMFRCEKIIFEDIENNCITEDIFHQKNAHVFIGATGIAVRKIAPFVNSKLTDPAVVVIDENGDNVIPILSGHIGGANSLSRLIAEKIGANAIITTATDVNGLEAIDYLASEARLTISDKESIQIANAKLLNGETINVYVDDDVDVVNNSSHCNISHKNDADIIVLNPKKYIIGVGCRKAIDKALFKTVLDTTLQELNISYKEIDRMASIELKASEEAIISYCKEYNVMFETYSREELESVIGDFDESDFVKEITGVSNVSQRAAAYGANLCGSGEFILKRKVESGITVSIVKVRKRLNINGNP
ncbi:MAG: cobalamin biosynthesis protein [Lachnospiraceae bacterium]|nr:cobalamin biosynthesis protein [Lachnospiraceae bacterium]